MLKIVIATQKKEIIDHLNVRLEVFVKEQNVNTEIELDGLDEVSTLLVGYLDGVPVSTTRIILEDTGFAKIGRVAVKKEYRKLGIGKEMIIFAENYLKEKTNYRDLYLDSQIQASGFYESLGYTKDGSMFLEANIPHIKMKKRLN